MVPSGPPTPVGGAQSVPQSMLRTSSGILGAQGNPIPPQSTFPSLIQTPRSQYSNMNMLGNISNVSALLGQSFGNGGSNSGLSGSGSLQNVTMEMCVEPDPLSGMGNGLNMTPSAGSFTPSNNAVVSQVPSVQMRGQHFASNSTGNQLAVEQQNSNETQNIQHVQQQPLQQFAVPHSQQQQQQQQQQPQHQYHSIRGGLSNVGHVKLEPQIGNVGHVKLEPQIGNEQCGAQQPQQQPQMQPMRNLGPVKLEPQLQQLRSLGPVKMEPQISEQPYLQQQQQQQLLQLSRQGSQVAAAAAQMSILQQQRLLQLQQQQQQQQQLLKSMPQQRVQLQQHLQQSNLPPMRSAVMKPACEPGTCARRLTQYMYHQRQRPSDNSIEFWRKFVAEYFAPNAKKRWCVSLYGSGRQTTGVVPQDVWHCEICNRKPGRGFETTVEVLPRLNKIKYDSGTLEELLYVDMPREYQNMSGQIVLDYAKAIQESVFEQLRVVREGQLRIVFSLDLKICSWEFCARRHEELIPRRLIVPQVSQLGAVVQKYQASTQNASTNLSVQELQNNCNMFAGSARQLAKALEVPLVNDLGYTKRYVRCLQISEVVNSMKDLIDYSRETRTGPMACLMNFPRRTSTSSELQSQVQQADEQPLMQNSNNDQNSVRTSSMPLVATNGVADVSNSLSGPSASTSSSTIVELLHQSSNCRLETPMNNSSPYHAQIPSAGSSTSVPQSQPNPSSPFPSPTLSASNNNPQQTSHNLSAATTSHMQQPSQSSEVDPSDSQSSVQQIIQEMMMSSQLNGGASMVGVGSIGNNEMKSLNGMNQMRNSSLNGVNCLVGTGMPNGSGISSNGGLGNSCCIGPTSATSGLRPGMANNAVTASMSAMGQEPPINHQQFDLGNQLFNDLGPLSSFNNLQFDWKSSP